MALNDDALTTLLAAQQYMRIDGETSAAEDASIERIINAVSRAIRRHLGRQLLPKEPLLDTDPEVSFDYGYDGCGYLSLSPREARSVSAVAIEDVTLDATAYTVEPRGKNLEGTYTWLSLPLRSGARAQDGRGWKVTVTGRFGAGTVPGDVEGYCLLEVDRRWTNPEGAEQRTAGPHAFSDSAGSLTEETREGLDSLRPPTIA